MKSSSNLLSLSLAQGRAWVVALAAASVLSSGCSLLQQFTTGETPEPTYASDADTNLKRGNEALANHSFVEAERYFSYVKTKYPYLEAAKIAELRLADNDFEREKWEEARDEYNNFVKLHPTHPQVDYAAYRAALTHYKQIPQDLFVLPPSYEKDQVEVRSTLTSMQDFVRTYPNSKYLKDAKVYEDDARRRLAQHELYVADFYAKRDNWYAVVGRLNTVVKDYPGLGYDEQALFQLHHAYQKLKQPEKAKEALQQVITRMPNTPAADRARRMLGS